MKIWIYTFATEKYKLTYSPFPESNDGYDHLRHVKVLPGVFTSISEILKYIKNNDDKIENFKVIK